MADIPAAYAKFILGAGTGADDPSKDPACLATLEHHYTLMAMAQEARKPIFRLKPADGAMGSEMQAAMAARRDFESLARRIATMVGLTVPDRPGGVDRDSRTGPS